MRFMCWSYQAGHGEQFYGLGTCVTYAEVSQNGKKRQICIFACMDAGGGAGYVGGPTEQSMRATLMKR